MFSVEDTIVAIATPHGRGGIGVVRISGPRAQLVVSSLITREARLEPRYATFTRLRPRNRVGFSGAGPGSPHDPDGRETVDQVIVTSFPRPHSYTGEDVVEISAHGSPVVLQTIVRRAVQEGARLARPGEFTLRAFLNRRIDLVQAEAVADLIAAATPLQARVAFDQLEGTLTSRIASIDAELFDLIACLEASLDFPDEGYHFVRPEDVATRLGAVIQDLECLLADATRGRMIREGATVVLAGRPNVGKSSLFNVLAGTERAIVTDMPGTTRDLITEPIEIEGLAVTLVDTAGLRDGEGIAEREGVARADRARAAADLVIVVLDGSESLTPDDARLLDRTASSRRIVVANKCDLPACSFEVDAIHVSAVTREGLDDLRRAIPRALTGEDSVRDTAVISNMRHITLMREAREALDRARAASVSATPEEFLLSDLQSARTRFDEIVGTRTSEDVLRHIFDRFCIGK
jgi:tRNA modification GTPase